MAVAAHYGLDAAGRIAIGRESLKLDDASAAIVELIPNEESSQRIQTQILDARVGW